MSDDWIAEEAERLRKQRASAAILGTRRSDGPAAARANALARRTGLPAETVERQYPEVDARDRADQRTRRVQAADPKVQDWFANPRNAAAATSDFERLINIGQNAALFAQQQVPKPAPRKPSAWLSTTTLAKPFARILGSGVMGMVPGLAQTVQDTVLPTLGPVGQMLRPLAQSQTNRVADVAEREAEKVRERYRGDSWLTEQALAGTESIVPMLGAALTRSPIMGATALGIVTGEGAKNQGLQQGMSEAGATLFGTAQGVAEGALEMIPMGELLKVPGRNIVSGIARYLMAEVPSELATTVVQSFNEWAFLPENEDKTLMDWASSLPEALASTAIGVLAGGGLTAATVKGADYAGQTLARRGVFGKAAQEQARFIQQARRAAGEGAFMDDLMADAEKSELREADPEGFRAYVEGLAQDTPIENVFVPASAVRDLFQDGDYRSDPVFGPYADQIDEALALDGDVVIPVADVATHLAGKPEWGKLRPHARFSPGGISEAEIAERQADPAEVIQRVSEQADLAEQEAEPSRRVFEDTYNRLLATGRDPKLAEKDATIRAAQATTRARALGMDPWEWHSQSNVEIVGPEGGATTPEGRSLDARGKPTLKPAIRHNGKVYSSVADHLSALSQIADPAERAAAMRDGDNRGFVDDRGRYMDRFRAQEFAVANGLLSPDAPDWAKTSPDLISENLMRFDEQEDRTYEQGSNDRDGRGLPGERDGTPLAAAPRVAGEQFGPIADVVGAAQAYAQAAGIDLARQAEYVEVDPEFAGRVATAYEAMAHDPSNPEVAAAYADMIAQTRAQYDALVAAGFTFEFGDPDSDYFASGWNALRDLRDNKRMAIFPTTAGFGSDATFDPAENPLNADTGLTWTNHLGEQQPVLANDLFRAVHDAFGHGMEGAGFRAQGEENAWQAHARLFTGPALAAMTSETRGQNSYVNYGPNGEANRTASAADTIYADQKTGLLPEWAWTENRAPDMRAYEQGQTQGTERGGLRADGAAGEVGTATAELDRPPVNADGTVTLDHFGPEGLTRTDPAMWRAKRSGNLKLSREERAYLGSNAPDRTYFGIGTKQPGGYKGEFAAGTPRYAARIPMERLYDVARDPDGLWQRGKVAASENAIKAAGYAGYWHKNPELGMVAVVYEPVDVVPHEAEALIEARTLHQESLKPAPRLTVRAFAAGLTEAHHAAHGGPLSPIENPEDYATVLKGLVADYRAQADEADSGSNWYGSDVAAALETTQAIIPELADPIKRRTFLTLAAILSPQRAVEQNWEEAIAAMQLYLRDGSIPSVKDNGKAFGLPATTTSLNLFGSMIETMGEQEAVAWLTEPHTGREMAEVRRQSGQFVEGKPLAYYTPNDVTLKSEGVGYLIFGPKVGRFAQNILGLNDNEVTVDLWAGRTYNRHAGRLLLDAQESSKVGVADIPQSTRGREVIQRLFTDAATQVGTTPSAMQAVLWYREKRLYREGGIRTEEIGFSHAAERALEKRGIDRSAEGSREGAGRGDPQGRTLNQDRTRALYQDTFYSALERAVEAISTNRAPAAQWLATLKKAPGVKAEELEWTGLEEWLSEQTAPVEKAELQRVLAEGAITVEERVLGEVDQDMIDERLREREEELQDEWERGASENFFDYYEPNFQVEEVPEDEIEFDEGEEPGPRWRVSPVYLRYRRGNEEVLDKLYDDEDEAREAADELDMENRDEAYMEAESEFIREGMRGYEHDAEATDAEYRSYSLVPDGDTSYRELLLYFPWEYGGTQIGPNLVDAPGTHWSAESGVVAHARFHDRRGPNGEKILFLDEIQSDWHQKGREQGYNEPADPETIAKTEAASEEADKALNKKSVERMAIKDELLPLLLPLTERALDIGAAASRKVIDQQYAERVAKGDDPGPEWANAQEGVLRDVAGIQLYNIEVLREATHGGAINAQQLKKSYDAVKQTAARTEGFELPQRVEFLIAEYDRLTDEFNAARDLARLRGEEARIAREGGNIANAPFKNTWPMLTMKRVIAWAAEGGYDQVAWIKQGENNGGMNDNVGWFYEKVLPNETNKFIKKFGGKVKPLTVNGLKKLSPPQARALADQQQELRKETLGLHVMAQDNYDEAMARAKFEEARAAYRADIEKNKANIAFHERAIEQIRAAMERGDERVLVDQTIHETVANEDSINYRQRRIDEERLALAGNEDLLRRSEDFDALWAKAQEWNRLDIERRALEESAGTNLGFDITPELKEAARAGFPLFQRKGGAPRGRVSGGVIGGTGPTLIEVFDKNDPSTVMHEFAHVSLEEFKRDAALPNAPQWMRDDWQTINQWLTDNGQPIGADGFIPTEAHELFARGFERYLMEGKAPVPALKRVFDHFRAALLTLYKHVTNLNSPITPEVRRVFDRMLATQEEIDAAADSQAAEVRFANAEQAGMTEAEFAAYSQEADASRSEAFDALLYRTMAAIRRERTKAWKNEERSVRDEVTGRTNERPEFRALHLLRTGRFLDDPERDPVKVKLDRAWLVERYGEDVLGRLPQGMPITSQTGDDAETIANLAGFTSADDMVQALLALEEARLALKAEGDTRSVKARMIADETAQIMEDRHGDPLNDGSIEEEALAAIHNDRQGDLIASENRALGRQTGEQATPYRMAREWAAKKIASGRVVDVASRAAIQRYARAYAKASRAFEAALASGNREEAFRQSEIRMLNHALLTEAKKAADRLDVIVPRLNRVAQQRVRKSVAQEYFDRAHALLEKFEFRVRSQKAIDEIETFAVWAAKQAEAGVDVIVPPRLDADGINYSRMSVEELVALDESVAQLLHLGRRKKKMLDAVEQAEYEERRARGLAVVEQQRQRRRSANLNPSTFDRLKNKIASFDAALLKMEQVFDWLDGGNPNGFFNTHVFRPLAEAQNREQRMAEEYLGKVRDLMAALPKKALAKWNDSFSHPSLVDRKTGLPFKMQRQDLIAMALNVGNQGNFDKLAGGYGWNQQTIMDVLEAELTAEEWAFVQDTWDLVNSLWPQIEALEKRVNGVAPEKVEARSFTLSDGTEMRGGYYPVVYDPTRNYTTEKHAGTDDSQLFSGNYQRATTRQGFAKERTEVRDRQIKLSLSVLNRHLNEVIHDLTHREAIMQADRILADAKVREAVDDALGPEVRKQFRPWLSHVANEWAIDNRGVDAMEGFARGLRTHSTIIGMGLRLTSILAQVAGYAGVLEKVPARWLGSGFKAVGAHPVETFDFVMERSQEVRARMSTMDRDMNANIRQLQGKYGLLANVRRFAFHGIGYMDRVVVIPAWVGAYHQAMRVGIQGSGPMNESEAAAYADKVIRETQGSGGAKDMAALQRGSEFMKLTTMFYSYASAFYNRQRNLGRDTVKAVAEGDIGELPALLARAWWLMVVSPIMGALPSALLSGYGPGDDDDEETTWVSWAVGAILGNAFYGIPIVRDVASSAISGFDYSITPASRLFETVFRATGDLKAVTDDYLPAWMPGSDPDAETDPSKRAVKTSVEAVGYVARLPVGQLSNAAQFLSDWAAGDADPDGVGDWMKGLQRGKLEDD